MKRYTIALLLPLLLCIGCRSSRQVPSSAPSASKAKAEKAAKVVMDEAGDWVLESPGGVVVARVYVENGSSLPDRYQQGYIRIVSADGLKIGYANSSGQVVLPPGFLAATAFQGPIAAVTPFSATGAAAATDDAALGEVTGRELWGVIDKNGQFVRKPAYKREWNGEKGCYVYTSNNSRFYITEGGEMVDF